MQATMGSRYQSVEEPRRSLARAGTRQSAAPGGFVAARASWVQTRVEAQVGQHAPEGGRTRLPLLAKTEPTSWPLHSRSMPGTWTENGHVARRGGDAELLEELDEIRQVRLVDQEARVHAVADAIELDIHQVRVAAGARVGLRRG